MLRESVEQRLDDESYYWIGDKYQIPIDRELKPVERLETDLAKFMNQEHTYSSSTSLPQIKRHIRTLEKEVKDLNHKSRYSMGFVKTEIENQIIDLNNKIRGINEALIFQDSQNEIERQMERDDRTPKVVGFVDFPVDIWNALSWNNSALWVVLDFCGVSIMKGKFSNELGRFKDWLKTKEKYTNKNREIDDTIRELSQWVEDIVNLLGLTRASLCITLESRWAS